MRLPARAAARVRGHLKTARFQSVEEFLGLASLVALFVLLALEPEPEAGTEADAASHAARPLSVAGLPAPSPLPGAAMRHD